MIKLAYPASPEPSRLRDDFWASRREVSGAGARVRHRGFAATTAPGVSTSRIRERGYAGVRVVERRFKARDVIFTPGDPDDQLYFLLEGTVRLYKVYGETTRKRRPLF